MNISYDHFAETHIVTIELFDEALYRVLRFLISQSIESNYEKIIDINTSASSGVVLVSIGNHGPGIPDGQKAAALQRYRGSLAPHVGLDLSMVHAVINASNGYVEIHDTVPSDWKQGITFKMFLQIPSESRLGGVRQRFSNR